MSDTKLRDLERRWKESGTVEDEAAYLLERVRVGDLTRERLELLAHLKDPAAEMALGANQEALPDDRWVMCLVRQDHCLLVRLLVALGHELLKDTSEEVRQERADLSSAEDWLNCPCKDHVVTVIEGLGRRDSEWSSLAIAIDGVKAKNRASAASHFIGFVRKHRGDLITNGVMRNVIKHSQD